MGGAQRACSCTQHGHTLTPAQHGHGHAQQQCRVCAGPWLEAGPAGARTREQRGHQQPLHAQVGDEEGEEGKADELDAAQLGGHVAVPHGPARG